MEMNIVFIEDIPRLLENQIKSFVNCVNDYKDSCKEKNKEDDIRLEEIAKDSCVLKDDNYTINVCSEELFFLLDNNEIPNTTLEHLNNIMEKYKSTKCLFVVDLCLDHQDDIHTGQKVAEFLQNNGFQVLYTTGTANYWQVNDKDARFIRRATSEDQMDDSFSSSRLHPLYLSAKGRDCDDEGIHGLVLELLSDNHINNQYFGGVIFSAIDLFGSESDIG